MHKCTAEQRPCAHDISPIIPQLSMALANLSLPILCQILAASQAISPPKTFLPTNTLSPQRLLVFPCLSTFTSQCHLLVVSRQLLFHRYLVL
ncbi:hypothetical protein NPIL_38711 [Nephila pilipes]|uniref:Uncharacterized protein n=1 Tax=Nephila pilipes TaxID=299642 RepID=A0A8X6PBL2_NEPPI|nr:hypothetical protein NPIL_38711 [Nephila pilipes]